MIGVVCREVRESKGSDFRYMRTNRKKTGLSLKLLVLVLVVYAAVQMVVLQIEINEQRDRKAQWTEELSELHLRVAALHSEVASLESKMDEQAIAQIARDLGWYYKDEILIVDKGR